MSQGPTYDPFECFVAVFDIIGFKALRQNVSTAGLAQKFDRGLLPSIQHAAAGKHKTEIRDGEPVLVPDFNEFSASYRVFSDTVFFWSKDSSLNSFWTILSASSRLLCSGFGMRAPFRGAIGHGDLFERGEMIIGSAIEDADEWEQCQAWVGASLTPKCRKFCEENNYLEQRESFLIEAMDAQSDEFARNNLAKELGRLKHYAIPIQSNPKDDPAVYDSHDGLVIDWTQNVFEDAAQKSLADSTSSHAKTIKKNTCEFEKWARALKRTS